MQFIETVSTCRGFPGFMTVNVLLAMVIVALLVVAGALLIVRGRGGREIKNIALRDLCALWTRDGTRTIHIAELSPLWRDTGLTPVSGEPAELLHDRAVAFLEKYILQAPWFVKAPLQQTVCRRILELLDREGDCPSVVNIGGDVEGNWDDSTFRILSRISLLDHTLNVTEQVVQILTEADACHVIPDTMVAALGHDLGKLESVRGYLYSLGEHPLAAGRPLAGLPGFKELPKKDEISRAIKLHHKSAEGLLAKTLKKADQLARQKELEEAVEQLPGDQGAAGDETSPVQPSGLPKKEESAVASSPAPAATGEDPAAAWQTRAYIFGEEGEGLDKAGAVPLLIDISKWFDAEEFLREIKPYINRVFGRRFMAFSMPDGHVYFQVKVLEEVARKQAEQAGDMEIANMAADDPAMRSVLLSVVHHLRVEHDVIARGLIKDNFFGGYFTVTRKTGKPMKGYYTPFHAEAFGSIAEMEQSKPEMLRNLQAVKPYLGEETRE